MYVYMPWTGLYIDPYMDPEINTVLASNALASLCMDM